MQFSFLSCTESCNIEVTITTRGSYVLLPVIDMHNAACIAFPQTIIDILEVLDTIQAWPEEVVGDMGPE